jgi:hypothetical protein
MKRKWSEHQDGTRALTSTEIMEFALKQYQTSVENNAWVVNSKQAKSIVNLTSQVGELKKWRKDKLKEEENKKTESSGKEEKQEYASATEYRKTRYEQAPKWMKAEPKDGKTTKKVKNVEYHWCTYHKLWQKHKAVDCHMNPANKGDGNQRGTRRTEYKKDERTEANNNSNSSSRRVTCAPTSNISVVNSNNDF